MVGKGPEVCNVRVRVRGRGRGRDRVRGRRSDQARAVASVLLPLCVQEVIVNDR